MYMEECILQARDDLGIHAAIYPADDPIALVQVIHGASEHKQRYDDFLQYLNNHSIAAIITDNRGHGKSISDGVPLGLMTSLEDMLDDQILASRYIKQLYPGKPLYMLGHSMGSLFARCYLREQDHEIDKLVLSGTVGYIPGASCAVALAKLAVSIRGKNSHSALLTAMSNSGRSAKDISWLSTSEDTITKYRSDPLCYAYRYQNQGLLTLFEADRALHQIADYACKNPTLPILSVVGSDDPVTGGEKGLKDSLDTLKRIGYQNVESIVYPGMRHEVLNEQGKEQVYQDVLAFFMN